MRIQKGFTLIELMVGIAILGIAIGIAIPNFSEWTVRMRVDNEISQLQRLILTARNTAINMEQPVTICPLGENNVCANDWTQPISVFVNVQNNNRLDLNVTVNIGGTGNKALDEPIIRVKDRLQDGDSLTYPSDRIVYQPSGQAGGFNGTFRYCPSGHTDKARAIRVAIGGRTYASSDIDSDGKDEIRDGSEIVCL